jgi:endonuclease YncB( thermonuclease family)
MHRIEAFCVHVIDGDTVEVRWRQRRRKVRLLGVDRPETHNHQKRRRRARQFGLNERMLYRVGQHAQILAKQELNKRMLALIFPDSIGATDPYGRLLCYVEYADGLDFGEQLLRKGYAFPRSEYHARRSEYFALTARARDEGRGIFQK